MAKVMLVEDDNNLREIYEARLKAEGYDIISAKDGEEALVIAKAEKPDLVISDVMMPKISGFEMLDILRNTDGLKEVKVIMLTALGQSDDQQRADKLGADRYLVKSQVTLEDIVKVAHDLLQDAATPAAAPATTTPVADTAATPPVAAAPADPVQPAPEPVQPAVAPDPVTPAPAEPTAQPQADSASTDTDASAQPAPEPVQTTPEPATPNPVEAPVDNTPQPPSTETDPAPAPAEPAQPAVAPAPATEPVPASEPDTMAASSAQEEADVEAKIEDFVAGASSEPTPPSAPAPEPDTTQTSPVTEPPTPTVPAQGETNPAEIAANALQDDALMSKAVDTLISDTKPKPDEATSKTDTPVTNPTSAPEAPEVDADTAPTTPAITPSTDKPLEAEEDNSPNGSVPIANKKIIQPLNDTSDKKDIQTLLALEEAKAAAAAPPPPPTAVIDTGAGAQPTPLPNTPAPAAATEFATAKEAEKKESDGPAAPPDPNSVAL